MSNCWSCENIKLESVNGIEYKCPSCNAKYYICCRCYENEKEEVFDSDDNEKGIFCASCDKHFCIMCWQTTGHLIDDIDEATESGLEMLYAVYEEGDYVCQKCIDEEDY